jgi:predicted ATPase
MDVLTDGLRSRAVLLVLDNCEHVVHSCGALAADLPGAAHPGDQP